jgi:hypothetical protein
MALKMDDDRVNQLVQQWLNERGYQVALLSLQQESGVQVTSPCPNFLSATKSQSAGSTPLADREQHQLAAPTDLSSPSPFRPAS